MIDIAIFLAAAWYWQFPLWDVLVGIVVIGIVDVMRGMKLRVHADLLATQIVLCLGVRWELVIIVILMCICFSVALDAEKTWIRWSYGVVGVLCAIAVLLLAIITMEHDVQEPNLCTEDVCLNGHALWSTNHNITFAQATQGVCAEHFIAPGTPVRLYLQRT